MMLISTPELTEEGAKDLNTKIEELVKSLKGEVSKLDFWGKRKFAYEIKNMTEGYYSVFNFKLDPENMLKFKNKLKLTSGVVRYLIIMQS